MTTAADFVANWWMALLLSGREVELLLNLVECLSDSLGLIQNHGVGAMISSLSISNPQQVEEHRIIKMSGGKCSSHIEIVTNQCILKLLAPRGSSWKVDSCWKCFTDGFLCRWMNEHVEKGVWSFTSSSGIKRSKASVLSTICYQLNKNITYCWTNFNFTMTNRVHLSGKKIS